MVAPKLEGAQQQLGEINDAGALAVLLVVEVQLDQLSTRQVVSVLQRLGTMSLIFVAVDEPLNFTRNPASIIKILRLQDFFDDSQLIVGIQNLERLR